MWIDEASIEALRTVIRHTSSQLLISKPTGEILWANPAFCEWIKYSVNELIKLSWTQISVHDQDLEADIVAARELSEYNLSYTIQKRYIPKNDKPQLGNLHVTRYPATGQIEFCFCRWEPLANGTAQAFELALESQKQFGQAMKELTAQVDALTTQTRGKRAILALFDVMSEYPKATVAVIVFVFALGGFDSVISTLQRLGYIPAPPVVVKEQDK